MFLTSAANKIKTHILHSKTFSENRVVYKMCIYMVQSDKPQLTMYQHTCA